MTMPTATITSNLNEPLDVKGSLSPKLTLNLVLFVNGLAETIDFLFSKVTHLGVGADIGLSQYLPTQGGANTVNIL
jgi:hypothetical protein